MSLTNEAKKRMLKMETYASFPFLIEVTHENLVYRYANSDNEIYFEGNRYEPACFKISPPSRSEGSVSDGRLTFSAIDQFWIEKIRKAETNPKLRFIATIVYENEKVLTVEAIEDIEFKLSNPSWNDIQIQFTMKYDDRMSLNVPIDVCNTRTTPAVC